MKERLLVQSLPSQIRTYLSQQLHLPANTALEVEAEKTLYRYRQLVRSYLRVESYTLGGASAVEAIVAQAASTMSDPADLINAEPPAALCGAGPSTEEAPAGCCWSAGGPQKPRPGGIPRIGCRRAGMLPGKAMRQRQGAKTQGVSRTVAWQGLAWQKVPRQVFRLQKRRYRAAQREDGSTVHQLQKLLVKAG